MSTIVIWTCFVFYFEPFLFSIAVPWRRPALVKWRRLVVQSIELNIHVHFFKQIVLKIIHISVTTTVPKSN